MWQNIYTKEILEIINSNLNIKTSKETVGNVAMIIYELENHNKNGTRFGYFYIIYTICE